MADTATNEVVGEAFTVGDYALGMAIAPNGNYGYVSNQNDNTVTVVGVQG
jgi:DNA-binding beta-propeller fold protein YncE